MGQSIDDFLWLFADSARDLTERHGMIEQQRNEISPEHRLIQSRPVSERSTAETLLDSLV